MQDGLYSSCVYSIGTVVVEGRSSRHAAAPRARTLVSRREYLLRCASVRLNAPIYLLTHRCSRSLAGATGDGRRLGAAGGMPSAQVPTGPVSAPSCA